MIEPTEEMIAVTMKVRGGDREDAIQAIKAMWKKLDDRFGPGSGWPTVDGSFGGEPLEKNAE